MNKTSVKLLLVEAIDSSREGMGKPWSRGTNSHLLFAVNATLNLSNVPFLRLRVVPHFSSGIVERAKRERA